MIDLEGGCLCGAVRFRITGTPMAVSHCHCTFCRRATGAPFITWITLPADGHTLLHGEPAVYNSSGAVKRRFCGACGTTLSYGSDDHPEEIDVSAASLDDPDAVTPDDHLWVGSMLSWVRMDDGLPRLDRAHWDHGYPERN